MAAEHNINSWMSKRPRPLELCAYATDVLFQFAWFSPTQFTRTQFNALKINRMNSSASPRGSKADGGAGIGAGSSGSWGESGGCAWGQFVVLDEDDPEGVDKDVDEGAAGVIMHHHASHCPS